MYLGEEIIVKINYEDWIAQTAIYLAIRDRDGLRVAKAVDLVFEAVEEGTGPTEPTLRMDSYFAVQLFNALAEALDKQGIKTSKDANLEGVLQATKYHLEDMRSLVGVKETE